MGLVRGEVVTGRVTVPFAQMIDSEGLVAFELPRDAIHDGARAEDFQLTGLPEKISGRICVECDEEQGGGIDRVVVCLCQRQGGAAL